MRLLSLAGALFLTLLAALGARAHTIPGGITLSERVALSDVVVLATIRRARLPETAPGKGPARLLVEAAIVERLRGEPPAGALRFEPHSHSGESYTEGEQVVLFLRHQDEKGKSTAEYSTVDDVTDRVSLGTPGAERPSAREVLAAVRAYAQALDAPSGAARSAQRKEATLALLRSSDAKLQASALRDLAQGSVALVEADVPPLLAIADDPRAPMASRVLLLEDLSRRKLADPTARYATWLETAPLSDMIPLARAAGRRSHPSITAALTARLSDADEETAALAARALGEPFHAGAVTALAACAAAPGRRKLASAAIESLGRMATPAAREALSELLTRTEDPERQRAIRTQQNLLALRLPAPAPSGSSPGPALDTSLNTAPAPPWRPSWTTALLLGLTMTVAAGSWHFLRRRR